MHSENLSGEEMLSQSLLTDEGFVNPAAMNELESTIANMPKTFNRLSNDPEWNSKKDNWTFRKEIVGHFTMWACRQSPYGIPNGLENVCKYLNECLKTEFKWANSGMEELSLCEINKALYSILYNQNITEFDNWNKCKKGKTPDVAYSSSYDVEKHPDYDFIDLDALLHNVCISIRDERRKNKKFDEDFDAKYETVS